LANTLNLHGPPGERSATQAFALWSLGFRPFYLLAAIFASLSIALWAHKPRAG
jgi:uncharacterized protein involved in response to NO